MASYGSSSGGSGRVLRAVELRGWIIYLKERSPTNSGGNNRTHHRVSSLPTIEQIGEKVPEERDEAIHSSIALFLDLLLNARKLRPPRMSVGFLR